MSAFNSGFKALAAIIAIAGSAICLMQSAASAKPNAAFPGIPEEVSITELNLSPDEFKGKYIWVSGYSLEIGGLAKIFLTKEHSMMLDTANSFIIEREPDDDFITLVPDSCEQEYVRVGGFVGKSKIYRRWVIKDVVVIYKYNMDDNRTAKTDICWSRQDGLAR